MAIPQSAAMSLVDLLVHAQRARPQAGADAGTPARSHSAARVPSSPRGPCTTGTTTSQPLSMRDGVSQAGQASAAVDARCRRAPMVSRTTWYAGLGQRGGDRRGGGEGDFVLAVLPAADDGDPRLHRTAPQASPVTCRCTRAPMPVTISCSIVPAQAAQSATVGSPDVAGAEHGSCLPGWTCGCAEVDDGLVHGDPTGDRAPRARGP